MKNLTSELIAKAKAAKSAEELLALAKESGVELTEEEAKTYFAQLNANGALSDDELEVVAGGDGLSCPSEEDSQSPDTVRVGYMVKVTDGSSCSGCGSMLGVTKATSPSDTNVGVFCNRCRKWITLKATRDNIRIF